MKKLFVIALFAISSSLILSNPVDDKFKSGLKKYLNDTNIPKECKTRSLEHLIEFHKVINKPEHAEFLKSQIQLVK